MAWTPPPSARRVRWADLTGDGTTDRADRQVLYANHGFAVNRGPQLAATLPAVLTHEDLAAVLDLSTVANDPDGDPVYYRVTGIEHGSAQLSADGRYLIFKPEADFTGLATLRITADDGYSASPEDHAHGQRQQRAAAGGGLRAAPPARRGRRHLPGGGGRRLRRPAERGGCRSTTCS